MNRRAWPCYRKNTAHILALPARAARRAAAAAAARGRVLVGLVVAAGRGGEERLGPRQQELARRHVARVAPLVEEEVRGRADDGARDVGSVVPARAAAAAARAAAARAEFLQFLFVLVSTNRSESMSNVSFSSFSSLVSFSSYW